VSKDKAALAVRRLEREQVDTHDSEAGRPRESLERRPGVVIGFEARALEFSRDVVGSQLNSSRTNAATFKFVGCEKTHGLEKASLHAGRMICPGRGCVGSDLDLPPGSRGTQGGRAASKECDENRDCPDCAGQGNAQTD